MTHFHTDQKAATCDVEPIPFWHEMLTSLFASIYPSDAQLDKMLDQLERTP